MKQSFRLLFLIVLLTAPVSSYAEQPAEIIWKAAETSLETAEENQAHADGRAVDMNMLNGMPVSIATDPNALSEKREAMQELLRNMEKVIRSDTRVQVFVSPIGGFHRDPKSKRILREATQAEMTAHWDHIHIATME
jgi:hypothetical protein